MSTRLRDVMTREIGQLRYEPTVKRVRAELGDRTVVDSTRAVLIWEPRRVVPSYAVPEQDVRADLAPAPAEHSPESTESIGLRLPDVSERPILDPSIAFDVHTAEGEPVELHAGGRTGAGFRLTDPELAGYIVLDFDGFGAWYEEDEQIVAHPRDPFHRIDILRSSRHVQVELNEQVLAESTRPILLFETLLPARYYLPREDVRVELRPSTSQTFCAYKGEATYWSPLVNGQAEEDLAWSYAAPLHEAAPITDRVAFFDERLDLVVDGVRRDRPLTPWSR